MKLRRGPFGGISTSESRRSPSGEVGLEALRPGAGGAPPDL